MADNRKGAQWWKYGRWALIGIAAREAYLALGPRRQNKRDTFNQAQFRAKQTGKQLIVIGDPDSGLVNRFVGRDYDCGDLCIDAVGCLSCKDSETGKIDSILAAMDDDSAVIFVSHKLQFVEDIERTLYEIQRVSGGDAFTVTLEPWTMASLLYPGAKRQFYKTPTGELAWRPLSPIRIPTGTQERFRFESSPRQQLSAVPTPAADA